MNLRVDTVRLVDGFCNTTQSHFYESLVRSIRRHSEPHQAQVKGSFPTSLKSRVDNSRLVGTTKFLD